MNDINIDKVIEDSVNALDDKRFDSYKRLEHFGCYLCCISYPVIVDVKHYISEENNMNQGIFDKLNSMSSNVLSLINTSNYLDGSKTYAFILKSVIIEFLKSQEEFNSNKEGYMNYTVGLVEGIIDVCNTQHVSNAKMHRSKRRAFIGSLKNMIYELQEELL